MICKNVSCSKTHQISLLKKHHRSIKVKKVCRYWSCLSIWFTLFIRFTNHINRSFHENDIEKQILWVFWNKLEWSNECSLERTWFRGCKVELSLYILRSYLFTFLYISITFNPIWTRVLKLPIWTRGGKIALHPYKP